MPAKDRFQLLALSCILIASKYLGPEEEIPPISEFWEFGNRCYSYEEIHEMELLTLAKYVRLCGSLAVETILSARSEFVTRRVLTPGY